MHWRIANEVARIEAKYPNALSAEQLFGLLDHFKYIVPQGSPMTGIGNNLSGSLLVQLLCDWRGRGSRLIWCHLQDRRRAGTTDEKTWRRGTRSSHIRPKGSPVKTPH